VRVKPRCERGNLNRFDKTGQCERIVFSESLDGFSRGSLYNSKIPNGTLAIVFGKSAANQHFDEATAARSNVLAMCIPVPLSQFGQVSSVPADHEPIHRN
jgi:hypothetical protein